MIAETDVLGLLLVAITVGISLAALVLSIKNSRDKSHTESYSDLDVLYLDILKMGVENPELRDREKTTHYKESFSNEQLIKYETYAYMVWNVCETVYDRTQGNEKNMTTWKPVIIAEKKLHNPWLKDKENHHKFKEVFLLYVEEIEDDV